MAFRMYGGQVLGQVNMGLADIRGTSWGPYCKGILLFGGPHGFRYFLKPCWFIRGKKCQERSLAQGMANETDSNLGLGKLALKAVELQGPWQFSRVRVCGSMGDLRVRDQRMEIYKEVPEKQLIPIGHHHPSSPFC